MIIRPETHDAVAKLIAYIMFWLSLGVFPDRPFCLENPADDDENTFQKGSREADRAGKPFADGWRAAFSGFKSDLEARVIIHKLIRNYMSNFICEHCFASYLPLFTFGDFRDQAGFMNLLLSHQQFLQLSPPERQSDWTCVPGWRKDRNLED